MKTNLASLPVDGSNQHRFHGHAEPVGVRHSEVEDDHSEHASSPHEDHDAAPLPDRAGLPGAHVADEGAVET